jgi:hypothetical protein
MNMLPSMRSLTKNVFAVLLESENVGTINTPWMTDSNEMMAEELSSLSLNRLKPACLSEGGQELGGIGM